MPDGKDILHGMQNYSEGHSIYEFYTYHFEGVDQLTGTSLYTLDPEQKVKAEEAGALVNINGQDYATATSYAQRKWAVHSPLYMVLSVLPYHGKTGI